MGGWQNATTHSRYFRVRSGCYYDFDDACSNDHGLDPDDTTASAPYNKLFGATSADDDHDR
jgi:hypothetical protein